MGTKKVLFCASSASHITNFHMPYIEYLKSLGYEIDIATNGIICSDFINNSYDIEFDKHFFSLKNIKTIYKLRAIMKREQYCMISSHATLAGTIARASLILSGEKNSLMFHTVHGYLFQDVCSLKAKIYLLIEKALADKTDLLITMNKEDYQIAHKYKLCKKINFIHGCGIVAKNFPLLRNEEIQKIKMEYGIKQNDKVLLYVGEFSKRKNHNMLISAFAKAVNKLSHLKLLLAGEGVLKVECMRLAESLGIKSNIVFCGQVENINPLYRISDIVVSSSRSEGLPFNIMEALHCGIPIIATKIKGHTDLINEGVNGNLVQLDDINVFSTCIINMITDVSFYSKIKMNSFLPKEYYIENTFLEWKDIYTVCDK